MLKFISTLIFISSLFLSLSASANQVFLTATCSTAAALGQCTLLNDSQEVVTCDIMVEGQTRLGGIIHGYKTDTLYQGASSTVYIHNYNPIKDPLFYVMAKTICNSHLLN